MKYDRYERDARYEREARAFGWPPAFFMSMIEHEQASDEAYERALTRIDHLKQREESAWNVARVWRYQRGLSITVIATVAAGAVAVAALLL